jgi:hypothetical protein
VTGSPAHLVTGPTRHGVVGFALALATSLTEWGYPAPVVRLRDWAELAERLEDLDCSGGVHVNFTDRLFGPTPQGAADRMSALVRHAESTGAHVTATLHDVPQPADGGNYRERVAAYRTVCAAVRGCATNSEHERSLLAENGIAEPADVVVIPLPLELGVAGNQVAALRPNSGPATRPRSVAVLGFVYPGKGHPEVLAAMADVPRDVAFLAIGECSAGHDDLAESLGELARAAGRPFTITGYVPDHELSAALHAVTVPVIGHRHVSASGSLNTWIAADRRPLAPVNRYTTEHDRRHPGTVQLYPDTHRGLVDALEAALAEPDSTWLGDGVTSGSPWSTTLESYSLALSRWHD